MKEKGMTAFIALLVLALVALGVLTAIGVIGDRAQAEEPEVETFDTTEYWDYYELDDELHQAICHKGGCLTYSGTEAHRYSGNVCLLCGHVLVSKTNSISSGYKYNWTYLDWDNEYHYAIQYIDEIDGGASCSGSLEAHRWKTDEETGEDVCMLCGYVHQEETPEGVNVNTVGGTVSKDNGTLILPTAAIITTKPIRPIVYINANEAIEGEFIVTKPCYTAAWSAERITAETVFEKMKYWGVDDYGNETYEFIDAETGAVTMAHVGDFVIVFGDASAIDKSVENRTPASAIEAANAEETYIYIPESALENTSLEVSLKVGEPGVANLRLEGDNSVAEDDVEIDAIIIPPEKLAIHFVSGVDIRKLLEKDLQMATSVLILDDEGIAIPTVGEQSQDNG